MIQWDSMWAHVDHSCFPVQAHMHRKALVFLASGPFWIRWGPTWAQADHSCFRVQSHMHRKALVPAPSPLCIRSTARSSIWSKCFL